ncbi:MAG: hypothetical protein K2L28_07755 [Muribaculaceae bacterium]|nr:hypothetical protein [Muribaculaceae bacterium]
MAKYSSKPAVINRPASELCGKFADFSSLQQSLDNLDADTRAKIGDIAFTPDSIKISTAQVGEIELKAVERTPERIRLQALNSPVPMNLIVDFKPLDSESTEVTGTIDVDLPVMLRPLVGPTLQKAADQFGGLFASLA